MLNLMAIKNSPSVLASIDIWRSHPEDWFGPFLINVSINCFCFGLLCGQVWTYSTFFRKDALWIRWLVAVVLFLSALTMARTIVFVLYQNMLGFGDWENAVGRRWGFYLEPVSVVVVVTVVQSFFVWRCYSLTNRNKLVLGILTAAMLSVLGLSVLIASQLALNAHNVPVITRLVLPVLILDALLDITITLIVSHKLITSQNQFNPNTDTLLKKLLAITWESASPPCIMHMVNIAISRLPVPATIWGYTGNSLTPWLYIFSLMHTLNSRSKVRRAQNVMIEGYSQELASASADIDQDQGVPLPPTPHTHQAKCTSSATGSPVREQHGGIVNTPPQLGNVAIINGPPLHAILPC